MKGLKKLFLASMVAVAGLSLASCGGKKNKTTEPTENTETTPEGPKYENNVLNRLTDIESSFNNIVYVNNLSIFISNFALVANS